MTPAVAEVVQLYLDNATYAEREDEPSLKDATQGNPISHSQLINLSTWMKLHGAKLRRNGKTLPVHLGDLLKGCTVYIPPKPAPKEQVGFQSRVKGFSY